VSTVFFASYLVGLRDGLEAALVVTILLTVLARSRRRDALAPLWAGVALAILAAAAVGAILTYVATSVLSGVRLESSRR
jgi:high-affinity iron transporter